MITEERRELHRLLDKYIEKSYWEGRASMREEAAMVAYNHGTITGVDKWGEPTVGMDIARAILAIVLEEKS